jgi:hypothetical protein
VSRKSAMMESRLLVYYWCKMFKKS